MCASRRETQRERDGDRESKAEHLVKSASLRDRDRQREANRQAETETRTEHAVKSASLRERKRQGGREGGKQTLRDRD